MTTTGEAIYEGGVLRLLKPIPLAEGTHVEVIILAKGAAPGETAAEILAQIAALPEAPDGEKFSGREHDRILYGLQDHE